MIKKPQQELSSNWVTIDRVVNMCHVDDGDDAQVYKQKFHHWVLRAYRKLNMNLLRRVKNVILPVSPMGTVKAPDDFKQWLVVGYRDSCGEVVPMDVNHEYEDRAGEGNGCSCGQPAICKCNEYERTEEVVSLGGTGYTKTVVSYVKNNGELIRETTEPVVLHGEVVTLSCQYSAYYIQGFGYWDYVGVRINGQDRFFAAPFRFNNSDGTTFAASVPALQDFLNGQDQGQFSVTTPQVNILSIATENADTVNGLLFKRVPWICDYPLMWEIQLGGDLVFKNMELQDGSTIALEDYTLPNTATDLTAASEFLKGKLSAQAVNLTVIGDPAVPATRTFNMTVVGTPYQLLRFNYALKGAAASAYTYTFGFGMLTYPIRLTSYGIGGGPDTVLAQDIIFDGYNGTEFIEAVNALGIGAFTYSWSASRLNLASANNPNNFYKFGYQDWGTASTYAALSILRPEGKMMYVSNVVINRNGSYVTLPVNITIDKPFSDPAWQNDLSTKLRSLNVTGTFSTNDDAGRLAIYYEGVYPLVRMNYGIENDSGGWTMYEGAATVGFSSDITSAERNAAVTQTATGWEGEQPSDVLFGDATCSPVTGTYAAAIETIPFAQGECTTGPKVQMHTKTETICAVDVRPCGCVSDTPDNRARLLYHGSYSAYCGCPEVCTREGFEYVEELGIFTVQGGVEKIYLKYLADLPCRDGVIYIPEIAAETIVAWVLWKKDSRRAIAAVQKEINYNNFKRERSELRKNIMRIRPALIRQALKLIPY